MTLATQKYDKNLESRVDFMDSVCEKRENLKHKKHENLQHKKCENLPTINLADFRTILIDSS